MASRLSLTTRFAAAALHAAVVFAAVVLALGYVDFDVFDGSTPAPSERPFAAVVFTGGFDRIDLGLQLLNAGAAPRLYISGVSVDPHFFPGAFYSIFQQRNPNIRAMRRLVECCVEWDGLATNTFQNGRETKCWSKRHPLTGGLLLVSSPLHMARAKAVLQANLPHSEIIPRPTASQRPDSQTRMVEYLKLVGTKIALAATPRFFDARLYGPFSAGCAASN